jgi:hypothetical protein
MYGPHITNCSPQGMRVLPQCKVRQGGGVMFVTIQRENIRPSKKNEKAVTVLQNCPMFAVRL